ncbi:MAG: hypothetical protein IJ577_06025 [Prevotella sp.]|nr:hypothetical protein [Prevotella sp.]
MYIKFTFDAEKKEAGEYLWAIMRKYNVDPAEDYSEESVKLQQMLQELDRNYQAEQRIKKLGLESLVAQLKTANEQVRTLMTYRNDERMYQQKAALSTARTAADAEYHSFILALNATAVMDESDTRFDQLISHINELIKYYRLYVVPKKGSSKSEDEDDSQDGGTEDNGIGSSEDGDSQDVTPATPEPIPENGGGDNGGASIPGNGEGGEG